MVRLQVLVMAAFATATVLPASAQQGPQPNGYTWGELALLPEYCRDVQGVLYGDATNPSPRAGHWIALMGQDFWHMHHYCRALNAVRKSQDPSLSENGKTGYRQKAMDDYGYVIKNSAADMPLMPEVLLRYGENQLAMNNLVAAKEAFEQARKLKPDYWPAYIRWIDVLIGLKQYTQARALAEEGLQQAPDSVVLKERLAGLKRGPGPAPDAKPGRKPDAKSAQAPAETHTATPR